MIYTVTFNPAIDYVVRLDAPLEVGAVNRAQGEDCVLGGKGINVSGVLAQLGCESVALGFVAGETGAWLERGLAAQGLKTDFVHLENGMTRINVKIKAGQETELNGAGPAIPESALQQLEAQLDKLTEGDILWGLKKYHGLDLEAAEDVPISSFAHKRDYKAVTVSTSMDQLIEAAMNQNFVPVVDDRGMFIGIVRRQAIIHYCYDKARSEQAAAKTARRRETVSAVAN